MWRKYTKTFAIEIPVKSRICVCCMRAWYCIAGVESTSEAYRAVIRWAATRRAACRVPARGPGPKCPSIEGPQYQPILTGWSLIGWRASDFYNLNQNTLSFLLINNVDVDRRFMEKRLWFLHLQSTVASMKYFTQKSSETASILFIIFRIVDFLMLCKIRNVLKWRHNTTSWK